MRTLLENKAKLSYNYFKARILKKKGVDMIFTKKYTTKWHDTDAERRVRATQMLVYMQETSNHHMRACGPDLDKLRDEYGLAFLLSKIRFEIYEPLYAFENIEVDTWTCPARGYSILRFYRIRKGEKTIAVADTTWALMNLNEMTLVTGEALDGIYDFQNDLPIELDVPKRFKLPTDYSLERIGTRKIRYSDLDYNMHMNNTKYPDMLCDFMPIEQTKRIRGFLLSYVNEAAFGDELEINHTFCDGTHYFRTTKGENKTCLEAMVILGDSK